MSLTEQSIADLSQIMGNTNDFGVSMTVTSTNMDSIDVVGFHTKHHTGFDLDGVRVESKTASVSISEKQFIDQSFTIRNNENEVSMNGYKIDVSDSTTNVKNYIVRECYPDEKLGIIVLILGDFE